MTDKTDTTALVIAEELNEWARDYAPTELATALATCAAVLLKNQNTRIAELEALQAAPTAPAAVAVPAEILDALGMTGGEVDDVVVRIQDMSAARHDAEEDRDALAAAPAQVVEMLSREEWIAQAQAKSENNHHNESNA